MFDLITSTGVIFSYTEAVPDPQKMQIVEFTVRSPFTERARVLSVNVTTLAMLGKSVEQALVEHHQRIAERSESSDNPST